MGEKVKLPGPNPKHLTSVGLFILVALGVVAATYFSLGKNPNKAPNVLIDKPAHAFQVGWLQGKEFVANGAGETLSLDSFKGRPLILNFWASWRYSCRAEALDFEAFWQRYKEKGVAVVGIAIQDSPSAAMDFARQYGKTYILGLDTDDGKAAIDYGVTGVPETFFIDRNGIIVHKEAGPVTAQILAQYTDQLLR